MIRHRSTPLDRWRDVALGPPVIDGDPAAYYRSFMDGYLRSPDEETRFGAYLLGRKWNAATYASVQDVISLHNRVLADIATTRLGPSGLHPLSVIHAASELLDDLIAGWTVSTQA